MTFNVTFKRHADRLMSASDATYQRYLNDSEEVVWVFV